MFEVDIQQDLVFGTAEASVERERQYDWLSEHYPSSPGSPTKQMESIHFY
jgi:hypothetical protein